MPRAEGEGIEPTRAYKASLVFKTSAVAVHRLDLPNFGSEADTRSPRTTSPHQKWPRSSIASGQMGYVQARRAKLEARERRRSLLRSCQAEHDEKACFFFHVAVSDMCPKCQEAQIHHKEFTIQSKRAGVLIRQLERCVSKGLRRPELDKGCRAILRSHAHLRAKLEAAIARIEIRTDGGGGDGGPERIEP